MDADLFLQQFGHLAQGEGGIKKLRDVILQLAVRGKLVEQNPADEPAEVLLKSILKKKEAILGKSKVKSLHRALANETTHDLPSSWVHTTLDELGVINPRNDCDANTAAGFVPMTLVSEGYGVFPRYEERNWIEISKGYTHFANDDVGLAKITPCFENSKSCVFRDLPNGIGAGTTELHIFRDVTKTIVPAYVWIWIKSPEFLLEGERRMTGSAGQKRVPKDYFALKPFPLPPLPEQKRIVAKVDELMVLCDKLEAERKAQRTLKTQAVQSTLHQLTNAESPASFGTSLNILEHTFGNWFDDLATVKHLRATILQLAVLGKLVPQNPTDEPASELLKRIEAEKKRLVKEGKIGREKTPAPMSEDDQPYLLPEKWEWVRLGAISASIQYGYTASADSTKQEPKFVRITDIHNSRVNWETVPGCDIEPDKLPTYQLAENDFLIARTGGTIGKSFLVTNVDFDSVFASYLIRIRTFPSFVSPQFLKCYLDSPLYWEQLYAASMGAGQPNVNGTSLGMLKTPLPPLAEQKRIVTKVDELMTLCDQLEAHITQTQTLNTHLMDSLIHRMTEAA
jgi:type I restriction enzyme S subunit